MVAGPPVRPRRPRRRPPRPRPPLPARRGAIATGCTIAPRHPSREGLQRGTFPYIPPEEGVHVISEDRIRDLAGHRGSCVVTSCYLDVDGRRHPRHADYETQLDHLIRKGREKAAGFGPEAARSVAADLDRISAWVKGGFDRSHVRGLAFF